MKYRTPRALEQAVKAAAKRSGRDVNKAIKGFLPSERSLCATVTYGARDLTKALP